MTEKQKQRGEELQKRFAQTVADSLPNLDTKRETFRERLQRTGKTMTNGEYLIQLASNPTEENLQRLKEAVEEAQTYYRNLKQSQEFRKRLEAAIHSPMEEPTPESNIKDIWNMSVACMKTMPRRISKRCRPTKESNTVPIWIGYDGAELLLSRIDRSKKNWSN
jgi:hypothetical protein